MRVSAAVHESGLGPWLTPSGPWGTGPLIEVHRLRAMQAIDVVGAPAYDPYLPKIRDECNAATVKAPMPFVARPNPFCMWSSLGGRQRQRKWPSGRACLLSRRPASSGASHR
jgi:hypothetical protein